MVPNPSPLAALSSSPRPASISASEMGLDEDSHQRAGDAHLVESMRARSSTLNQTSSRGELLVTPSRERERGGSGGNTQRRGSVGTSNAIDRMDHLADDLEIDQSFYERGSRNQNDSQGINNSERQRQQRFPLHSMQQQQSPSVQQSAAVARFYRQRRNLSDSSIDSQGGAYIDHRRQPHSLAVGNGRGVMANDIDRIRGTPGGYGESSASRRTALRREISGEGTQDDLNTSRNGRQPPLGPNELSRSRSVSPSQAQAPSQSLLSSRTARQSFTTEDLDEHAILSDGDIEEPTSPRARLARHTSQTSHRSAHDSPEEERRGSFSHELSRQGSFLGAQEDVCFPAHGAADPGLLDLGMSEIYGLHEHQEAMHQHHHHHNGVAGVLHNFPFPFDFGALEEFAEAEKDGMPIPGARKKNRMGMGGGTSPPDYGASSSARQRPRMGMGMSSSSGDEGRRTMRQRKLSESVAPGRFQRKLAIFEGEGDEGRSEGRSGGNSTWANILDAKTPLMGDKAGGNGGAAGNGYGTTRPGNSGPGAGGTARPYRFSFYSNSLPSTIHARSLAEIPAEGQTFEELFVGHRADYEDESTSGGDPRTAFSPPSHGGTGANTPSGYTPSAQPSTNGTTANSARPGGIAQPMGASAKEKGRTGMMRTEIDAEANTWWLDVMCPTDQEMKVLSKVFGIHPLTTEDILMEETREKIELFRNYYFVCFRSFEQDPYSPTYLEPLNMYIIVFREGTLSFHFRGTPHPQNVRRRIKQLKDYINVTSDWISYALIDDVTDAFGPLIMNIEYEVDSIDELVLILKEAEQSDMLRRIGTCRKKVMGLLRLMGNKADVVKGLSKRCNENWSVAPKSDIGLYLSDIQDHITTSTQNLTHYEKILSRSHSNYLAQISIEMTDANNQINDVLSKLTALGTVLIPMNLITGLWGMNVHVPGQDVDNLHWFFSILGCLGAIAIAGAWLTYRVFVKSA